MINVAICDDDKTIIDELSKILSVYAESLKEKISIKSFYNGKDLLYFLENNQVNIIYLDIQMDNISGIEVGEKIRNEMSNDEMQIIYISAIKDYAMELFKLRPNNFLIKPFSKEEVEETLETAIRLIGIKEKKFTFNINGKQIKKKFSDIIYFESFRHKIKIVTKYDEFEFYSTISEVYNEIKDFNFAICHTSFIVNLEHIEQFKKYEVTMSNGTSIKISRGKSKQFMEQVALYDMK